MVANMTRRESQKQLSKRLPKSTLQNPPSVLFSDFSPQHFPPHFPRMADDKKEETPPDPDHINTHDEAHMVYWFKKSHTPILFRLLVCAAGDFVCQRGATHGASPQRAVTEAATKLAGKRSADILVQKVEHPPRGTRQCSLQSRVKSAGPPASTWEENLTTCGTPAILHLQL